MSRTIARSTIAVSLALASGVLLAAAFPPYDLWQVVWVAFVPVAIGEARLLPPRLAGLGTGLATFDFIAVYAHDVYTLPETPLLMRAMPLSAGVTAFAATRLTRGIRARLGPGGSALFVAFGWVGFEFVRSYVPGPGASLRTRCGIGPGSFSP